MFPLDQENQEGGVTTGVVHHPRTEPRTIKVYNEIFKKPQTQIELRKKVGCDIECVKGSLERLMKSGLISRRGVRGGGKPSLSLKPKGFVYFATAEGAAV